MRNVHHSRGRTALALAAATAAAASIAAPSGVVAYAPATTVASTPSTPASTPAPATITTRVSASLRYTDGTKNKLRIWSAIRVTITRDGAELAKELPLPERAASSYLSAPTLQAIDLDDDHDPEVIVDVASPGFERWRTVVYHRVGDQYEPLLLEWSPSGYRLEDLIGADSPEFVSADGRFAALFGSTAPVPGPLRIQRLAGGALKDVSASSPARLRRDARLHQRAWKRAARRRKADVRPALAAYVVDLVRLGEVREARRAISSAGRRGHLRGSVRAFARTIDGRLVAWGYAERRKLGRIR